MIALGVAVAIVLVIAAVSDREDGQDSLLIDLLIFALCLGGILYKRHKAREDDEF